jgi:prevent-host-death family protein
LPDVFCQPGGRFSRQKAGSSSAVGYAVDAVDAVDAVRPLAYVSTSQNDQLKQATPAMREIQASEAKTHLPQLLDEVERGETLLITRHGRAIARIVPEAQQRQEEIDRAIESIKASRRRTGRVTLDEVLSARREGHKY